jgi:hypothetical protein
MRAAYQDFLTLWKDADPDIPILSALRLADIPNCSMVPFSRPKESAQTVLLFALAGA